MGKTLDQAQRQFVDKFLVGQSKRQQAKTTDEFLKYDRRQKKVAAALDTLEANHPQRKPLQQQLGSATTKAQNGDFKGAYDDLNAVKKAARGAAKGFVAGLSPTDVQTEMTRVGGELDAVRTALATAQQQMTAILNQVAAHAKCSDAPDAETAFGMRRDLTAQEAQWRGDIGGIKTALAAAGTRVDALRPKEALTQLAHRTSVMQQGGDSKQKKAAEGLTKPLLALNSKATVGGTFLTQASVTGSIADQLLAFEDALKPLRDLSSFQGARGPSPTVPTASVAALNQKEAERLQRAQDQYVAALRGDAMLAAGARPNAPATTHRRQPDAFRGDDVLGDEVMDARDEDIDDALIGRAKAEAVQNLKGLLGQLGPNSDKLFDLMVKSRSGIEQDLSESLGFVLPITETQNKLLTELSQAIVDTVASDSPNKVAADLSSVTVNGQTYTKESKIGQGGVGEILRFVDGNGRKMIVKSLMVDDPDDAELLAEKRAEMENEMRMHRQVCGGENGTPHPNVVPMRGVAVGPGGKLVMLMDEAEGGDVATMSQSMNELSRAGIIPEGARTAMVQRTMRQAVRGLKAVHAQDAVHLDVKMQNYLLDADGNVQIADFGSAAATGNDNIAQTTGKITTAAFAPPEFGTAITRDQEVFWLGSMLQSMSSDVQDTGTNVRSGGFTGTMVKMQTKHDENGVQVVNRQTSLDRLRNAMIDADPQKRPSLDAVLLSSYLDDAESSYTEEDVADLMKAATAYNKKVGKEVSKVTMNLNWARAKIAEAHEETPPGAPAAEQAALARKLAPLQAELDSETAKLKAINARQDVQPLLDRIQKASAAFR